MELLPLVAGLFGAGLLAGFMAGLLGIGGGIVTIPALFIVFEAIDVPIEWRMHTAIATSLVIIIVTNISSIRAHHKRGGVDWDIVKDWWIVIVIGTVLGSFFAKTLKTEELIYIFASFATLLAIKMFLPLDRLKLGKALPSGPFRFLPPAFIGFISAIMGIGGGSFSVPYMTLYGVQIHRAVGTASLVGLVISVAGGFGYLIGGLGISGLPFGTIGFVNFPSAAAVGAGAVLMAPVGAMVAHKLPKNVLSVIFGLFLVLATYRLVSSI
ncbi:UPF0721 transmembrane protein [Kordiimonas sediminis]|uniref:Probable membrane transporter protein n=1 Tax=Kordiimonas sediminis TaxID=1735581 RepID=A0A919AY04_9PROT|nr:sulfite exporter TauE/SafE family protein [Kordiimonas sediminis]GHF28916.1 UPF0721 transmembrane protein [Kordiimonas sediminis]